jgi:nitrite reductase/ring-hydroxylating ferredoxin subunit
MTTKIADQLVALSDLDHRGVTVVQHRRHGALAVGISDGRPFAVSNRCRHLFASLGEGCIVDGQLECPWHHARYDVRDGRMVAGPSGVFRPVGRIVKHTAGRRGLTTHAVELRDGAIWLAGDDAGDR